MVEDLRLRIGVDDGKGSGASRLGTIGTPTVLNESYMAAGT